MITREEYNKAFMSKYLKVNIGDDNGCVSFQGAVGYMVTGDNKYWYFLYSSGMMGSVFDLTPEIKKQLENHFKL